MVAACCLVLLCRGLLAVEETIHSLQNPYFDSSKFYFKKDSVKQGKEYCYKSTCSVSPSQCIRREEEALRLFFSGCPQGKRCIILDDYSGECVDNFEKNSLTFLYPGDKCTAERSSDRICGYGKRL